ncbi:hypothetical protein [Sulfurospirillum cavolei]|uniref:hypothetical protein n=1 Tax=Sulfurospirillum cavolei TaxID=366522 RepID=UPI0007649B1D|nr:hypothetical protein [Sulfurospirillum cavolei]
MSKKYKIVQAFNLPVEYETLEQIEETHNYISDKLILDAVNGVNVVARDLHEVSKLRQSWLQRTTDTLFGNSKKRQDLINENLIEGLNACSQWLQDHDQHISRIDHKISIVASELSRTQDEILKFYAQHQTLKSRVTELKEVFFEFETSTKQQISYLRDYIRNIDIRTQAMDALDLEISRLTANKYDTLALPLQIYTALDNIKSGYGGMYYDSLTNEKEKKEFQERIANEFITHFKSKCDLDSYMDYEQLAEKISTLQPIQKDSLAFISTQHYNTMITNNGYPEATDLVSIMTSYEKNVALQEVDKKSNIANFITYNDYLTVTLQEHLKA